VERLTAADADDVQRRIAGGLVANGLQEGDRVAVVAPSSALLLNTILGVLRRGIVPVVLSPALLEHERAALIADAQPVLTLDQAGMAALADADPADVAPHPRARPLHYTSGTTGRSKGVWSGLLSDQHAEALVREEQELWGFEAGDRHLVCSPLHHSAPIRFAAGTLLAGGEVMVLDRFRPEAFAAAVREWSPTTAFMVPAHLQRLREAALPPLTSFRLAAHAGAPCPQPLKRWALDRFPDGTLWEFYGSTEGQFTACSPEQWQERPGTVGPARPGRQLRVGEDASVWCEVPDHARFEYWNDPAATAAAWRDGAFTVGDLGRLDADGFLYLEGRREDLIISGGVNVYPAEVEQALRDAPGVVDVAVFGVADERWGQRVCAAVLGDADPGAVKAHARARLAAYKCPKDVFVVDELPRTPMGKVRRLDLAERFGQSGASDW
jgi:acyl-CoA synthetase (AMP-forming)/AMP-acid ligase II